MRKKGSEHEFDDAFLYFAQTFKNQIDAHQTVIESPMHAIDIPTLAYVVETTSFGKYKLLINKGRSGALSAYVYNNHKVFSYESLRLWALLSNHGRKFMTVLDKGPEVMNIPKKHIATIGIFYLFFLELRDKTADSWNYSDFYTFVEVFISTVLNHRLDALDGDRFSELKDKFIRNYLKLRDACPRVADKEKTVAETCGPKEAPCGEIPIAAFNDQEKERKMTPNSILNELEVTGMTSAHVCAPDFKYENGRCFARVTSFERGSLFLAKNDELSAARVRRVYPIKMPLFNTRTVRVLFHGDENDPEINVIFNSEDSQSDDEVLTSLFYLNAISNNRGYLIPYWDIARRFFYEEPVPGTELSLTTIRYAVEFEKSIAKKLICPNKVCGFFFDFVKKKCEDVGAEQRRFEAALAEQKEAAVEKTGTTSLCGAFIAQEPDNDEHSSLILLPHEEIIDKSKTIPFVIDNRGPIRVIERHLDTLRYLDGQLDRRNTDILFLNSINCDWFPVVELLEVVKKAYIRPEMALMALWSRATGPVGVLREFYQTFVKVKDSIDVLNKDVVAFYLNEFISRFKPGTGMPALFVLNQIRDEIKPMAEKANSEFSAFVDEITKEFIAIPFGCSSVQTPSAGVEVNCEAPDSSEDDKLTDLVAATRERLAKDSEESYRAIRNAIDDFIKTSHDFRQSACDHKQPVDQNVCSLGNYLLSEATDKDSEHGYALRKPRLTSSDKPILRPGEQLVKVSINNNTGQLIVDRLY